MTCSNGLDTTDLDSSNFPAGRTLDFDYISESELVQVGSCAGHPLLMLEVKRRECRTESKQGTLCLHWKCKAGNVPLNPNRTEVESSVDGFNASIIELLDT